MSQARSHACKHTHYKLQTYIIRDICELPTQCLDILSLATAFNYGVNGHRVKANGVCVFCYIHFSFCNGNLHHRHRRPYHHQYSSVQRRGLTKILHRIILAEIDLSGKFQTCGNSWHCCCQTLLQPPRFVDLLIHCAIQERDIKSGNTTV